MPTAPRKRTGTEGSTRAGTTGRKTTAGKTTAREATARKTTAPPKTTGRQAAAPRTAAPRTTARTTTARTTTARKASTRKASTRKASTRKASTQPPAGAPAGFPGNLAAPLGAAAQQAVGALEHAGRPVAAARQVLDRKGGLPVYLGTGALAAFGAIGWPVAAGVGAGYAAIRQWGSQLPEPLRSLTGSRPPDASS